MIKHQLTNPAILSALASNGHGSKIMIADGNFPAGTMSPPGCEKVYLHLKKDLPTVTDVLTAILATINIESAILMDAPDHAPQEIHEEFIGLLGTAITSKLTRLDFYDAAGAREIFLVIITGDSRRFANLILTMGVFK